MGLPSSQAGVGSPNNFPMNVLEGSGGSHLESCWGVCRNYRNRFGVIGARLSWTSQSHSLALCLLQALSVCVWICVCTFVSIYLSICLSISPSSPPSALYLSICFFPLFLSLRFYASCFCCCFYFYLFFSLSLSLCLSISLAFFNVSMPQSLIFLDSFYIPFQLSFSLSSTFLHIFLSPPVLLLFPLVFPGTSLFWL